MKSMIRMAGVMAVCLAMLLVMTTGCESTGSGSAGGDGQLAAASSTCAVDGCSAKGDSGISAMVDGKKATFCSEGCKAKTAK